MGGIDEAEYTACLGNEELVKSVFVIAEAAEQEFGIETAPSFLINGTLYAGTRSFEDFQAIIDPLVGPAEATGIEAEAAGATEPAGAPTFMVVLGLVLAALAAGAFLVLRSRPAGG